MLVRTGCEIYDEATEYAAAGNGAVLLARHDGVTLMVVPLHDEDEDMVLSDDPDARAAFALLLCLMAGDALEETER